LRKVIGTIVGLVLAIALIDGAWELAERWFPAAIASDASAQDMLARFVMAMPPAGQAIIARRGEWVRYSTPQGAEYVAICVPAFSPETVHRDA